MLMLESDGLMLIPIWGQGLGFWLTLNLIEDVQFDQMTDCMYVQLYVTNRPLKYSHKY